MKPVIACLCLTVSLVATLPGPPTLADDAAPVRVVLIGDSTVKNGSGRGEGGLWGWGQVLAEHFDADCAVIENRAIGGRSSRTYLTEGRWDAALERLRPGDFVLMQFGHNDGGQMFEGSRPRASIKGNGDETAEGVVEATGQAETVHSYGWYLRKYIADAKAKGATPIVLSPVPRNMWLGEKVLRASRDYGRWARESAEQGGALFVDLNDIIAQRYEELGELAVSRDLFTVPDHTHTTEAGARVNAACVAQGIKSLPDCPLARCVVTTDVQPGKRPSDSAADAQPQEAYRFLFTDRGVHDGGIHVSADAPYDSAVGYGFDEIETSGAGGTSKYFSVRLPEGNYRVGLRYGRNAERPAAVKAELRRLMTLRTDDNRLGRRDFVVNIRTPAIGDARDAPRVRLKDREKTTEAWAWDDRLTLEFCAGPLPTELTIVPAPRARTIFLAGDSTVTDQPREPWGSWGQALPLLVRGDAAVANHAQSGERVDSSMGARRFEKIFSQIRKGDVLLVQFGHNDMKRTDEGALADYRRRLAEIVAETRRRGATPILVTSMERKSGIQHDTLGDYPNTVRELAAAENVALVDLHAMSRKLYAALGERLDSAFQDGTHHTTYGAYLLARCVAAGIQEAAPDAAKLLRDDLPPFDMDDPPTADQLAIPVSDIRDPAAQAPAQQAQPQRQTLDFDADWRFVQNDVDGGEAAALDDQSWQRVSLPHDWAIAGPFDAAAPARGEGGFLPTGVGWYRKHFRAPAAWKGCRVFVEFDGVMANSDVWVNGHHLGQRPNGYVTFRYDVTDHLKFGDGAAGRNVIAVRTDTSQQVASRWYTGSGIYRHVRLLVLDPLHVAESGVAVAASDITDQSARVDVAVELQNAGDQATEYVVRVQLIDPEGLAVAQSEAAGRIEPGDDSSALVELQVANPQRWDIDSPQLYTAVVTVLAGDEPVDEISQPFGIRTAEFRADSGFWLNGRHVLIKGVCLHHTAGAFGAAVPLGWWEYQLKQLQQLGVNAVRTAHNPVAPEFLDLCDRMGILVMDEFFDCWTVGKRKYDYHLHFREWAHRDMRDVIRRDRNHPSVILYSVGNEIHDTPREELAKEILRGLVDECHAVDPTRPVTQALFRPNVSHDYDNGLADMLDVIGTNYRDLELLQAWRDNPQRKIIGTEQSHDRSIWLACRDHPQHAGQFLWVGIDYLGESRRWPVTTFNAGLIDRTGRIHPRGRQRQSWWSDQPMVHAFRRIAMTEETPTDPGYEAVEWRRRQVLFDDWSPRDDAPHTETVEVYSNCEEVELLVNGESLGAKRLLDDASPLTWDVDFAPGTLTVIGRRNTQEVARHELQTAGPAAKIQLQSSVARLAPGWDNVAVVRARVVDEHGVLVPRADCRIDFTVDGPGAVAAVDNGSIVSHESFLTASRSAFQGQCTAFVRVTGAGEPLRVTAAADGLRSGTVEIQAIR